MQFRDKFAQSIVHNFFSQRSIRVLVELNKGIRLTPWQSLDTNEEDEFFLMAARTNISWTEV